MTQEQALAEIEAAFPEKKGQIKLERNHSIGMQHGSMDQFYIWEKVGRLSVEIMASSDRSWEHAIAIAKSENEDIWPEDHEFTEAQ